MNFYKKYTNFCFGYKNIIVYKYLFKHKTNVRLFIDNLLKMAIFKKNYHKNSYPQMWITCEYLCKNTIIFLKNGIKIF